MRDQPIAAAAISAQPPWCRMAKNGTPKKANAAPVCPEGNEWYLFLNNRNSLPFHKPFHSCVASVLLGRARPVRARTEFTKSPEIVAASIIQSKTLHAVLAPA